MKLSRTIGGLCLLVFVGVFLLSSGTQAKALENDLSAQGKIKFLQSGYVLGKLEGNVVVGGISVNVDDSVILEGKLSFDELKLNDQVAVTYFHSGEENIAKRIRFLGSERASASESSNAASRIVNTGTNPQEIVVDTKEGDIVLSELFKGESYKGKISPFYLGKKVPAEFYLYLQEGEVSKEIVVLAVFPSHTASVGMHIAFHVIFYDDSGTIVGAVSSHAGTIPEYLYSLQSDTDGIPLKRIQAIKSFKLVYYQWNM